MRTASSTQSSAAIVGFAVIVTILGTVAAGATVPLKKEPPEGALLLGQRVQVDDGTCPAGQVKLVTAGKMTPQGVARSRVCVKR